MTLTYAQGHHSCCYQMTIRHITSCLWTVVWTSLSRTVFKTVPLLKWTWLPVTFRTPSFLLCDIYAKRGICRRRVSVCLCVCVSVTLRYCIKIAKLRITQITPHDSQLTLVFWHQSSLRNLKRITPYGGDKCRWGGLKFVTFDKKCSITWKQYKIDA